MRSKKKMKGDEKKEKDAMGECKRGVHFRLGIA